MAECLFFFVSSPQSLAFWGGRCESGYGQRHNEALITVRPADGISRYFEYIRKLCLVGGVRRQLVRQRQAAPADAYLTDGAPTLYATTADARPDARLLHHED